MLNRCDPFWRTSPCSPLASLLSAPLHSSFSLDEWTGQSVSSDMYRRDVLILLAYRVVGCLHGAVLAAFIAGILDLVEVLCRRRQTDETVLNNNPLLALTISREIAYALSFGLRFLFFWAYAGCPPPKDVKSSGTMHCGSWSRWGLFGHILRWSLLVAVVAIASLQVTYRIYTPLRQIDLLHQIEGVVEVSVSAVFILKLLLNVYLANLDSAGTISRLNVLLCYSPMIIALSMSVAIGAVDVIQCEWQSSHVQLLLRLLVALFSESILGRLLQGVELYIVILYMLVVTCGPLNEEAMKQQPPSRLNRSSSFHNFGARLSGFLMGPPRISLAPIPPMQTFMPTDDVKVREGNSPVHRPSYANRLSTWVSSRRVSFRSDLPRSPGLDRLWDQDRAERGSSPVGLEPKPSRTSHETYPEPKQSPAYPDPVYTSILRESATEDGLAETADPVLPLASPRSVQELLRVPRALTPNSTDSPIHGLHGIIQPLQRRPTEKSTTSQAAPDPDDPRLMFDESARSSGISGLLRQQEELDKSIAALKLFSADANTNRDTRSSFDTTSHTTKAASEFSLSNFPEPPWGRASVDSMSTVRPIVPVVPVVEEPEELVIEEVGRNREQSIPVSENGIREILTTNRNVRSESGGTQYEITSFIGGMQSRLSNCGA